jgi:hypothetical protein
MIAPSSIRASALRSCGDWPCLSREDDRRLVLQAQGADHLADLVVDEVGRPLEQRPRSRPAREVATGGAVGDRQLLCRRNRLEVQAEPMCGYGRRPVRHRKWRPAIRRQQRGGQLRRRLHHSITGAALIVVAVFAGFASGQLTANGAHAIVRGRSKWTDLNEPPQGARGSKRRPRSAGGASIPAARASEAGSAGEIGAGRSRSSSPRNVSQRFPVVRA